MEKFIFRKSERIGALDAETDQLLDSCFVESDIYSTLLSFEDTQDFTKRIVVGRTGTGKTALLKQLVNDDKIKGHKSIDAENTVFEHIVNNVFIQHLKEREIDLRGFYKVLWIHVLLIEIINQLYPNAENFKSTLKSFFPGKKRTFDVALAQQYVDQYSESFFNDNIFTEITNNLSSAVQGRIGTSVFGAGGNVTSQSTETLKSETTRFISNELLRKQRELIRFIANDHDRVDQVRIILSVDDLDRSWLSATEIRYDFINALLEAFKDLLDIRTVKILISVRTDILKGIYQRTLRQEEKDRSLIVAISWTKNEIREIIDKRLDYLYRSKYSSSSETATMAKIFDFNIGEVRADDYILDRTMLRPRDAIDFVNLCIAEGDGSTTLDENSVIAAEENYYVSRKSAIVKEWKSMYGAIAEYTDCITLIETKVFSFDKESPVFKAIIERLLTGSDAETDSERLEISENLEKLMNIWFTVGIIGIHKNLNLVLYSSFHKTELDISDYNKQFEIHPLFFRK